MPNLRGLPEVFHGDTITVDTSELVPVGTRGFDGSGNEFIYLQGTASVVAGDWVTYAGTDTKTAYVAARITGSATGPVAISGTSTVASRYGWFQIFGRNTVATVDNEVAAGDVLYTSGTTGSLRSTRRQNAQVTGAVAVGAASGLDATVFITYPFAGTQTSDNA